MNFKEMLAMLVQSNTVKAGAFIFLYGVVQLFTNDANWLNAIAFLATGAGITGIRAALYNLQ